MSLKLDIVGDAARDLVDTLQSENDIARIVDPISREVLYWPAVENGDLDSPCFECNAVWGRGERCPNCSSLEALKLKQRTYKIELNNNRAFWVKSRPLTMDGRPCVLETVNDVTDGLLVEGGDRGAVSGLIDSLNGMIVTDALTSLLNRRFIDDFNHRLAELAKEGVRVNVAMIDVDGMKAANDTYGHPAGDAVLKDVAGWLKLHFSAGDDGSERYAVRYGGDEFVVIDVGGDPDRFAGDLAAHYAHMRRTCHYDGSDIPFSLSVGTASSDEFGWEWKTLLTAADQRMYAHKRTRR